MNKVKNLIKQRGLKQRYIAELLKIDEATLSKWLNGHLRTPDPMKIKIAKILGYSVGYLFFSEESDLKDNDPALSKRGDRGI